MTNPNDRAIVQVVFARPEEQSVIEVDFEPGMTAADAVERAGLVEDRSVLTEQRLLLGVWGIEVAFEHPLKVGDRVELSRPLQADPRAMRRELVTDGRVMGGASALDAKSKKWVAK